MANFPTWIFTHGLKENILFEVVLKEIWNNKMYEKNESKDFLENENVILPPFCFLQFYIWMDTSYFFFWCVEQDS